MSTFFSKIILISISLFLFVSSADAALIIQAPKYIGLNSGLVGYWSFDGKDMANVTAYDRSGQGNNGTLTNGPTRAIGKIGQGLSFDGTSNQSVKISHSTSLNLGDTTSSYSISTWFKLSPSFSAAGGLVIKDPNGNQGYPFVLSVNASKQLVFVIYAGAGGSTNITTTSTYGDGLWHSVVAIRDVTADQLRLYVDGIQVISATDTTTGSTANSEIVCIGGHDNVGAGECTRNDFNGQIDDVRIYNRALNENEIKRLYRIGATLKINTSINNDSLTKGLVGYWSFNAPDIARGGATTTVYDRSGNAKNGSSLGQDISAQGLVGWWKLDEGSGTSAGDSSGTGNTATLVASPATPTWTTSSKLGANALSFDGSNDYVTINDHASLDVTNVTISQWINKQGNDSSWGMIVSRSTSGGDDNLFAYYNNTADDEYSFAVRTAGGIEYRGATASTGDIGSWVHFVATYDGTTMKMYRNAVEIDSNLHDYGGNISSETTKLTMGCGFQGANDTNPGECINAILDDVRVYNRALSAAEISQLYSYALPKFAPTAGKLGQGIDSTQSYVNPGNVSSSVNSFSFWMKTASSSPTINLLDLNASQSIKIVGGTVTASGITSPSIFVDGVSGTAVNAGWHHIAVTTGTAVNASAVNLGLNATTTAPLDGVLDDVRFYNRVINNDEIKRLYRIGATLKVNTSINNDSLAKGLVGYWSFDGKDMAGVTAYDRSGQSNNGTLTNGPARAIGKIGQGLSFDGSNDYVNIPNSSSLQFGTNNFTISLWVRPSSLTSTDEANMVRAMEKSNFPNGYWVIDFNDSNTNGIANVQFETQDDSVNAGTTQSTGEIVLVNAWTHVVIVMDRTNFTTSYYANGALDSVKAVSSAYTGTLNASTQPVRISSAFAEFPGLIDDVRVYNRALTPAEIQRLYNLGR